LFKGNIFGAIGIAQPIEKVGDGKKKGWHCHRNGKICDGGRQMCFSTAVAAQQQDPAFQILSVLPGNLMGCHQRLCLFDMKLTAPARQKALKSHVFVGFEVAQAVQSLLGILDGGFLAARAYLKSAKIRMINREIAAPKPNPAANGAIGVTQVRRRAIRLSVR